MNRVETARRLRQDQTEAEARLWSEIRNRQFMNLKWKRQVPIDRYFVDFVCEAEKLIVELDGSQHMDATAYDEKRTQTLEKYGYRVLRFWNEDVFKHMDYVLNEIENSVGGGAISPHPAVPSGRGPLLCGFSKTTERGWVDVRLSARLERQP